MQASFSIYGVPVPPEVFSLAAFGLFLWEGTNFYMGLNSSLWPWVKGNLDDIRLTEGDDDGSVCYMVSVRYSYVVRKKQYEGTRLTFIPQSCGSLDDAKKLLKGLYVGKIYRVYYDRKNPQQSVLKPGVDGGYGAYMLLILSFAVMPLFFI